MSACGRQRRWKFFATVSFMVLSLLCLAELFVTIHIPLAQETQGGEPICPLSAQQEKEAIEAFDKLALIFKDPRCFNCHGGINPFDKNTKHGGGFIDVKETLKERLKSIRSIRKQYTGINSVNEAQLNSSEQQAQDELTKIEEGEDISKVITSDGEDISNMFTPVGALIANKKLASQFIMLDACEECHSLVPLTWRIPRLRNNMFTFDGVSPRPNNDLCSHMKEVFPEAEGFLAHMQNDPLIKEGFKGTRALNDTGIDFYKQRNPDKTYMREPPGTPPPPGITQAAVIEQAKAWVKAMGGKFHKPDDCGCTPKKYKMSVKQHWTVNANMGIVTSRLESEAAFLMDLLFEAEGQFSGHATVTRTFDEHQTGLGSACDGKAMWFETWKTTGIVNQESGEMQVKARFDASPKEGVGTCQTKIGTFKKPIRTPAINSDSVATPMRNGFTMPARVGEKRHFEWEFPPAKNTVDFSIVEEQSSPKSGIP